jgi:hypothetical protein
MSEENRRRLKQIVHALAVLYVMTFLSGFLQDTQFNFFNYIFFAFLFLGGILLMRVTVESRATGTLRRFLFLTGISSVVLLISFLGYEWSRLTRHSDSEAFLEAFLYWITLFFGIAVIRSLVLIRRIRGLNAAGVSAE